MRVRARSVMTEDFCWSSMFQKVEGNRQFMKIILKDSIYSFKSGFILRRANIEDAQGIHNAHMKSIQQICSKDHSFEEIKAWGSRPYDEAQRVHAIKNDLVFVVEHTEDIEGYFHLRIFERDGIKCATISGLYLTPKAVGQSMGKAFVKIMMEEVYSANIKIVTLESTITAHNFYRKVGFIDDGPESTVKINGTPVRCYPMRWELK